MSAPTHTTLADVCEALEDGDWIESKDQGGEDFRLLQVSNIGVNDFVETGNYRYITEETFNRLRCREVLPGHILLSRMPKPIGRAWLVSEMPWRMVTAVDVAIAVPNDALVSARFLAYVLNAPTSLAYCEQRAAGATRPRITRRELAKLPLNLPSREVQETIADILSTYDDLIENNRRRMALLEEAARQLYREWFVRLRFPGHEHTRVTNGVPEGWEHVRTPEAIEVNPTTTLSDETEHWSVEMADLPTDSMVIQQATRREGRSGSRFRNGDTLFARITPCLENGKTAFVDFLENGETARGSTEFIVLRGKRLPPEYVYCLARTHDFRGNAIKSMVGSSGRQRVQESCFDKFLVLIPITTLLDLFTEYVRPQFRQIKTLHAQNQKLRAARDLLLPRLMSGEIAV